MDTTQTKILGNQKTTFTPIWFVNSTKIVLVVLAVLSVVTRNNADVQNDYAGLEPDKTLGMKRLIFSNRKLALAIAAATAAEVNSQDENNLE